MRLTVDQEVQNAGCLLFLRDVINVVLGRPRSNRNYAHWLIVGLASDVPDGAAPEVIASYLRLLGVDMSSETPLDQLVAALRQRQG